MKKSRILILTYLLLSISFANAEDLYTVNVGDHGPGTTHRIINHINNIDVCNSEGIGEFNKATTPIYNEVVDILKEDRRLHFRELGLEGKDCKNGNYGYEYFNDIYSPNSRNAPRILKKIRRELMSKYDLDFDVVDTAVQVNDIVRRSYFCRKDREKNLKIDLEHSHYENSAIVSSVMKHQIFKSLLKYHSCGNILD